MLTPRQLENIPERMVEIYADVEAAIIADMARRIARVDFIPSAEWQYRKLLEMGYVHNEIVKRLSRASKFSRDTLEQIMKAAGIKSIKKDMERYRAAGLKPPSYGSPMMQAILQSGLDNTQGMFDNITRTTAASAAHQFENVLDRAWLQVTSGGIDRVSAVRSAITDLADKGLRTIEYPTGHVDYLDVATRRATLTGVNQTAGKMQEALADEMGADLMELTAHAGARDTGEGSANHASWQGKIVSRSGRSGYLSFEDIGYGTGPGFKGWNCHHDWFPFFEGISEPTYTQEEIDKLSAPMYTYNGTRMNEYQATQTQRAIERRIRKYRRELAGMEAGGQPKEASAAALAEWLDKQENFIKQTGLKRQYDRERVGG